MEKAWQLDRGGGYPGGSGRGLSEGIDTSTPGGELLFHMMRALAQFERKIISERTKAGLAARKGSRISRGSAESDVRHPGHSRQGAHCTREDEARSREAPEGFTATLYRRLGE